MQIIKVNAIESTNSFLKDAIRNKTTNEPTCVWTNNQTNGKGQHGAKWESAPFKNLTFSVFFPVLKAMSSAPFSINMITTISIYNCLSKKELPNLKIKWPNDILSANQKIGGILIENSYKNGELTGTVIGIGLNVNQETFTHLPRASSIKNITGSTFNLETLLHEVLEELSNNFISYTKNSFTPLKERFEKILFRNKKPSTFTAEGLDFTGIIQGVTDEGKLIVMLEDAVIKTFDLKEISLKY